jgi:hypothetical protein
MYINTCTSCLARAARDVLSIQPAGVDGASFCKRLTSQTENVTRGVSAAIMNSAALVTRPFSYFETLQHVRAADASAFATGLSAWVLRGIHKRRRAQSPYTAACCEIVWFLKGTHPRLRFPRHRSLAFFAVRRRSFRRLVVGAEAEGFEGKPDFVGHDDALSCYVPGCQIPRLRPVVSLDSSNQVSPQVHHGANANAPSRDHRTAVQRSARNADRV